MCTFSLASSIVIIVTLTMMMMMMMMMMMGCVCQGTGAHRVQPDDNMLQVWTALMDQFKHCAMATLKFAKKVPGQAGIKYQGGNGRTEETVCTYSMFIDPRFC